MRQRLSGLPLHDVDVEPIATDLAFLADAVGADGADRIDGVDRR
jgi:hypothetical protein